MKQYLVIITLFLTACATQYDYTLRNNLDSNIEKGNRKTIKFVGGHALEGHKISQNFKDYGIDLVYDNDADTDYIATIEYDNESHSGYTVMPTYGKTGIKSIDTTTYGEISRGYGNYSYSGRSQSTINYDYGITGYQSVPYIAYKTSMMYTIRMNLPKRRVEDMPILYVSELIANDDVHDNFALSCLIDATKKYGKNAEDGNSYSATLKCNFDDDLLEGVCSESLFSYIKNLF